MIEVYFTNTYLSICFALKCIDYTMQNLFNFIICPLKLVVCLWKHATKFKIEENINSYESQ